VKVTKEELTAAHRLLCEHCEPDESEDIPMDEEVRVPWWLSLGLGVVLVVLLYYVGGLLGAAIDASR